MLFITEHDEVYLPHEYHFSHNISVRLYDDLVFALKDVGVQKKANITIRFKKGEHTEGFNNEDVISWLITNGYKKEADEVVSREILFAIISDICHFIFQALDSAKRMKMTVAFSLIRKPFLENLLILEQLITDENSFLSKFGNKPEDFDPGKLKDEEKEMLIENCTSVIGNNFILSKEMIYQLRFDKKNPNSIYAMCNLATHLVTTRHSAYKTDSNNLNFVFSRYDEWDEQLSYFYYFVPYLLFYTAEIVDLLLYKKKLISIATYNKRKFIRLLRQMMHFDQSDEKSLKGKSIVNKFTKSLKIKCKSCGKINQLYKSDFFSLSHNNYILCKHCLIDLYNETNSIDEYIKEIYTKKGSL